MNTRGSLHLLILIALAIAGLLALSQLLGTAASTAHAAPPAQDDTDCEALNEEGIALYRQARYLEALASFQDALTCYREAGNQAGEGNVLNNIGIVYENLGQYQEALAYYEQALTIAQEIGDRVGEAETLTNVGVVYYRLGQYQEALACYEQALPTLRETGNRRGEAQVLSNIGIIYRIMGQYAQALDYYQQALAIQQQVGDRIGESKTLNNMGNAYYALGQYQEALDCYQQALIIHREVGDRDGEGHTLSNTGMAYERLGQYDEALAYYEQALTIQQEIGDRAGEEGTLSNIGVIYQHLGQYAKALDYLQQAVTIAREIGDRASEGAMLNNTGVIYRCLGRYAEALDYHRQALAIRQEIGDRAGEGNTLNNIGIVYERRGQHAEALDYFRQALTIVQQIGDRAAESGALNNIGIIYDNLGRDQEASDYFQQALTIRQEIGDRAGEGTSLGNIGNIHARLGQYAEALDHYQRALAITQEIGDRAGEGNMLNNIGIIYDSLGQYAEALDHYQQALTIYQEIGDRDGEGRTLNNIGAIHSSLGQHQEALDYLQQALAIHQEIGDRDGESMILSNIGGIYEILEQYQQALDCYGKTINVVETMRREMRIEEFKSGFAAGKAHVYDSIISLLIQIERPAEAFAYVQRAKARTFLDQLANVHIDPRATDDPQLLAREQELLGEIHALEILLSRRSDAALLSSDAVQDRPPSLSDEQRSQMLTRLEDAYREHEQLLTQIKLTNPHYASLRSVQASTLITVQRTLPANVTLLEYYITPDQTFAFVVTQDDLQVVEITVTRDELTDRVTYLRDAIAAQLPQAEQESAQGLYDLLFAPLREHIHTDALYIAPHGVLHYLPCGALHDGERYLIENYVIAYLPSGSVLQYVLGNTPIPQAEGTGELLALCNPEAEGAPYLNHAAAETDAIAALFDAQAIVGDDATETRFFDHAPQANRIHLAAHGQFNPFAPQFSRILLAPDGENDGYLEVHEVFNLQLPHADLVTLSACETQLGELSDGDELVGLSRAFVYAGTPSLVSTLWSVDDASTRFLMERFYRYLKQGYGKASALRQAQVDTMEQYPGAYHWAPFTLIGDMGPVEDVEGVEPAAAPDRTWLVVGGGVLLAALPCGGVLLAGLIGTGIWLRKRRA